MKNNLFKKLLVLSSIFIVGCNSQSSSNNSPSNQDTSSASNNENTSSNQNTSSSEKEYHWNDDETLKILTIGNSFSDDSMEYVANIALSLGVKKVVLGNLYIGGCSLATHASNALADAAKYEYRTNTGNGWTNTKNYIMSDAIVSEDWDYISLQQSSGNSGIPSTYTESLAYLIDYVSSLKEDNTKLVWNMTWAYQQNSTHNDFAKYNKDQLTMYNAIINAVKQEVLPLDDINLIIPTGTSIQNARTSFVGDNLTRDGYHLTYDFGRYIAGLTFINKLTGLDIDNVNYKPTSLDENYQKIAIESVKNAIKNPFEVTSSIYKEEPQYDYSNYNLLDLELTELAYWQSMDKKSYNKLITSAGNSKKFHATKRFTKLDLPLGTIIEIQKGYQYRPEAWKDDTLQTSRPDNVSTRRVTITADWWGEYVYRAFNISKNDSTSLENDEESKTALKIYVPKEIKTSYTILNYEKIDFAFYDSTNKTNYNKAIDDDTSLSKKFFTTKRFTKEELPLGSIIKIAKGWQYRPEAWKDDAPQTSRPKNTSIEEVVVTESWWSDYIYRAFNVSKIGTPVLTNIDTNNVLTIYIPNID